MWPFKPLFYLLFTLQLHKFTESFLPTPSRGLEHCVSRTRHRTIDAFSISTPAVLFASSNPKHLKRSSYNDEEISDSGLIPSPLDNIVDVKIERNSVVYELTLSRDLGFEINQGYECPVVGKVGFYAFIADKSYFYAGTSREQCSGVRGYAWRLYYGYLSYRRWSDLVSRYSRKR